VILIPLIRSGLPRTSGFGFACGIFYFSVIGLGFMLAQVAFMQRFSVYLGHPTYAVVVTLFSMILLTGVGSLVSDRVPVESQLRVCIIYPLLVGASLLVVAALIQPVIDGTIDQGLAVRAAVVIGMIALPSLCLGLCFPLGLRLMRRLSIDAGPWMWGVNGAASVLGAVSAVALSMWVGIEASMRAAGVLYLLLAGVAPILRALGDSQARAAERSVAAAEPRAATS
jgi:hypothetical protein